MVHPLKVRRSKVNGSALANYIGEPVAILGEVMKVNMVAKTFELRTADNCIVHIVMKVPLEDVPDGWVEVRGEAQGKKVVLGLHLVQFSYEAFKQFDRKLYDDLIVALNTIDNPFVNGE